MILTKIDKTYNFSELFNTETGFHMRSNVYDVTGDYPVDTGVDPFMGKMPSLLDIGIMGEPCVCAKDCPAECYQGRGHKSGKNITLDNFKLIIDQVSGEVFQVALGGSGDPDTHPDIHDILKYCKEHDVVPNFTTSGIQFNEEKAKMCKEFCGAIAVSWHDKEYTHAAIKMLLEEGVKTNIHYVLGQHTIDDALSRLRTGGFPKGINAVVFLAHKPVGLGSRSKVLDPADPRVKEFFELIDSGKDFGFKIGLDACQVPGVVNFSKKINRQAIDTCDGARFSAYIGPDMIMTPCSFDQEGKYGISLLEYSISDAWFSAGFNEFRDKLFLACPGCDDRLSCMGGCPVEPAIVLCDRKERT